MEIRPYQDEAIEGTFKAWEEFDRVLGVMGTGGGKTCIAAEIARRRASVGPTLFLADA
jgi:superfamily II DNA or RNA helicase